MSTKFKTLAQDVFAPTSSALLLAALGVPAYGAFRWLRYGVWEKISVNDGMGFVYSELQADTKWIGANRIIEWYLDTSLGWTLLALAAISLWMAEVLEETARRRAADT